MFTKRRVSITILVFFGLILGHCLSLYGLTHNTADLDISERLAEVFSHRGGRNSFFFEGFWYSAFTINLVCLVYSIYRRLTHQSESDAGRMRCMSVFLLSVSIGYVIVNSPNKGAVLGNIPLLVVPMVTAAVALMIGAGLLFEKQWVKGMVYLSQAALFGTWPFFAVMNAYRFFGP